MPTPIDQRAAVFTIPEAAGLLKIGISTLRTLLRHKAIQIRVIRFGWRTVRLNGDDLRQLIATTPVQIHRHRGRRIA